MGDQDDRPAAAGAADVLQEMCLGRRVQGARRLVEHEHARVAHDRPGHRDQLALAQRQPGAALAQHGLVALGEAADEPVGADEPGRRDDPRERAVDGAHGDVLGDGAREQLHLLRHDADLAAIADRRQRGQVEFVEQHAAGLRRLQAEQDAHQRALARARRAGDAQHRAWRDGEADARQRRPLGAGIAEGDRLDLQAALDLQLRAGQPAAGLAALAQQLVEAADRLARLLELRPGARDLAHRRQGAGREDRGRHHYAHRHVPGHDHPRAEIDQHQRGQVLQGLGEAAGEVGDAARLQPGPGAAGEMALVAPLHVRLERQRLDGQRLRHGLAQDRGLGAGRAGMRALMRRLAALAQRARGPRRSASRPP